jgi:hypothetical protein
MVRPNIGTVAGGAWVWDDTADLPWEARYSTNYATLRLPEGADLADIQLPTGVRQRVIRPLAEYEIGYDDPGRLEIRLTFTAVIPPVPLIATQFSYGHASHFDQIGRVVGHLDLYGERIPIDCLAMRDRSWGLRVEHRPRQTAYVTGVASDAHGFLALSEAGDEVAEVSHGFLLRDGTVAQLEHGRRMVDRDPRTGHTAQILIEAVDSEGRQLEACGHPVSRIIINRHSMIDSNSLMEWTVNGEQGWGEDQDLWPVHSWAEFRRAARAAGADRTCT